LCAALLAPLSPHYHPVAREPMMAPQSCLCYREGWLGHTLHLPNHPRHKLTDAWHAVGGSSSDVHGIESSSGSHMAALGFSDGIASWHPRGTGSRPGCWAWDDTGGRPCRVHTANTACWNKWVARYSLASSLKRALHAKAGGVAGPLPCDRHARHPTGRRAVFDRASAAGPRVIVVRVSVQFASAWW